MVLTLVAILVSIAVAFVVATSVVAASVVAAFGLVVVAFVLVVVFVLTFIFVAIVRPFVVVFIASKPFVVDQSYYCLPCMVNDECRKEYLRCKY